MTGFRLADLAVYGVVASGAAVLVLILAGAGTRWGAWDYRTGFQLLRIALAVGLLGGLISLAGLFFARDVMRLAAVAGLVLALLAAWLPLRWYYEARRVPPIHDITTDLENPPAFVAVLALRKDAPNPPVYGEAEVAAQQRRAYPHIMPLILPHPPAVAFAMALQAAKDSGWEIAAGEEAQGRIEATDTTFWFGFIDDIVVRITPNSSGSRVDVRSVSRLGKSDVGTNARRITAYLERLKK